MGLLYQGKSERNLSTKFIAEAAHLLGQEANLFQIDSEIRDINNDPHITYHEAVPVNILFEDNPKPILKKYGWFTEDDDLPYIAYITRYGKDYQNVYIRENCIVEIYEHQNEDDKNLDRRFIITNCRGNMIDPLYWICKLAPYRDEVPTRSVKDFESPHNNGLGYTYIQRKKK